MPILACIAAIFISAATLALSVHLITAPDIAPQGQTVAASSVRQIPLGKTSDVSRGDPQNQLTPVYPTAPAKDVAAAADTAATAQTQPEQTDENKAQSAAASNETTGAGQQAAIAPSATPAATPVASGAAAAPNSCAIAACGSAYRSFRASDCTYQPFEGPRKICELTGDGTTQEASAIAPPATSRDRTVRSTSRSELADVERVVRSLPRSDYETDYEDARVIMVEPPRRYYGRPGVIYYEE